MTAPVCVAMITWPNSEERIAYFRRSVAAIHNNLHYCGNPVEIFASGESEGLTTAEIIRFNKIAEADRVNLTWRNGPAHIGANMNTVLSRQDVNRHDFILLTQDDYVLMDTLDIEAYCDFLSNNNEYALIRLGYSPLPAHTLLGPIFEWYGLNLRYLDGRSAYLYGDQPHLRRKNSLINLARYSEQGGIGNPEVEFNGTLQGSKWLIAGSIHQAFEHCGTLTSTENRHG